MSQIVKEKENEIIKFINSINIYEITNEKIEKILPAIKVLFTELILSESSESTLKKFIKLSIHLIKYAHYDLVQNLSKFKASDETNNELVNDIYLLELLYSPIVSLSDKSIEFCNYFHQEESENGIQVLFGLVMDEKLLSIQHETETNNITLYLDRFIAGNVFMALLNISKAYDRNKDKWNNLNAYQKLLDLSQKINKKNVILKCIMTMGNIASDEDLNNFSSSPKGFKFLTAQIDRFSNALKDKLYLNDNKEFEEMGNIASDEDLNNFSAKIDRLFSNALKDNKEFTRELFRIDEGEEKVKIIQDNEEGWNLYECLQALYKFAINDKLKNTIYETFQMKDSLRKIVYNGNETEQEYGFKVLNQLCFDKNIALDISNDKDLMKFMNDLILKKTNEKKLVKNIDGILWLINKKGEKEIKSEDLKKHVFISYNSESRSICLDIKTFLEKIGFKCWIDIENIHGSSIDAMAKGIEAASCVLICMTEKYKESNNCRMEAEYTLQRKIPFIPLILQKSYRPDGWLGFMLGSKIYIDFTKNTFNECSSRLQKELKNFQTINETTEATVLNKNLIDKKIIENNNSVTPHKTVFSSNWTQDQVLKYFRSKNVNDTIIENLKPCDGCLLEQLFRTLKEVPEFFHSILRADSKASLMDIVLFTTELRRLFNDL